MILKKKIAKLTNNVVFVKTMKNARKHRYIKLVTTGRRKNYLVSELNCYTTKFFYRKFITNRNEKNIDIYGKAYPFTTFNTRIKRNINVWVLV